MVDENYFFKLEPELDEQLNDIDEYITSQLSETIDKKEPAHIARTQGEYLRPHLDYQPPWTRYSESLAWNLEGMIL